MLSEGLMMSPLSLVLSFGLIIIALVLGYKEKLALNKEMLVSVLRMVVQLFVAGFVLTYIFKWDRWWVTIFAILFISLNAAYAASKRGKNFHQPLKIAVLATLASTLVALGILVLSGAIKFTPAQIIPITRMVAGNSMKIIGLTFRNIQTLFRDQRQLVEEKLALGATMKQASQSIIKESIQASIQPTIDSVKTVGLVLLPGMMTGMMLAGSMPINAILYQIVAYFMLMATATITAIIVAYLAYQDLFDSQGRLVRAERNAE